MKNISRKPLEQGSTRKLRHTALASAFMLGVAGTAITGCAPSDSQTTQVDRDTRLVQGRDECISVLTQQGQTTEGATTMCDEAIADAVINQQNQPRSSSNGGGFDMTDAAVMYLLLTRNSSPAVYSGSPSTGLRYMGGGSNASPRTLTPSQTNFYRSAPSTRTAATAPRGATNRGGMSSGRSGVS